MNNNNCIQFIKIRNLGFQENCQKYNKITPFIHGIINPEDRWNMFEQSFKNIDNLLRKDKGLSTEIDYVEQTSWL